MEGQMALQGSGSPRNHDYRKRDKQWRKQVVRSLVGEKPFRYGEERGLQALHEQVDQKSGSHQRLMPRRRLPQLILSLGVLFTFGFMWRSGPDERHMLAFLLPL